MADKEGQSCYSRFDGQKIMTDKLTVTKLGDNLYRIQEDSMFMNVDAYLICGQRQAMVIDGLGITPGLYEGVRYITDLPLFMVVTHGHPDHAGVGMKEFIEAGCQVYLSSADRELVKEYAKDADLSGLKEVKEYFDLGGARIRSLPMPGHTPGSVMLFWEEEKILFSSDAIGSGSLWMQLPESSSLEEYLVQLKKLELFLDKVPDIKIYPGHSWQVAAFIRENADFIDNAYVKELIQLTENIVDGKLVGEKKEIPLDFLKDIDIRSVTGNYVTDYCYDIQKVHRTKEV